MTLNDREHTPDPQEPQPQPEVPNALADDNAREPANDEDLRSDNPHGGNEGGTAVLASPPDNVDIDDDDECEGPDDIDPGDASDGFN